MCDRKEDLDHRRYSGHNIVFVHEVRGRSHTIQTLLTQLILTEKDKTHLHMISSVKN
jgi:hypothetical protein